MIEVVAALIRDGDRFLICQRPAHKARGMQWEFPGGKVEPGESPEEALIRECREELGVTLRVNGLYAELVHDYPELTIHLMLLEAVVAEGTPTLLEHHALRWILPEETEQFAFCPADQEFVKKIRKSADFPLQRQNNIV